MMLYSLLLALFAMGSCKRRSIVWRGASAAMQVQGHLVAENKNISNHSGPPMFSFFCGKCNCSGTTQLTSTAPHPSTTAEEYFVDLSQVTFKNCQEIGEGSFGTVNLRSVQQQASLPAWLNGRQVYTKIATDYGVGYEEYAELYINILLRYGGNDHVANFLGYGVANGHLVLIFENEAMLTDGHSDLFSFVYSVASRAQLATVLGVWPRTPANNGEAQRQWAADVMNVVSDQVRNGLDGLHEHGIVHGDIKLDNFILTRAGIKFIDFGSAGAANVGSKLNATVKSKMRAFVKSSARAPTFARDMQKRFTEKKQKDRADLEEALKQMHYHLGCRIETGMHGYVGGDEEVMVQMVQMLYPKKKQQAMQDFSRQEESSDGVVIQDDDYLMDSDYIH